MNIVAISGSLRKGSFNTMLVHAFQKNALEGMSIEVLPIADIPLFNADLESAFPPQAQAFKDKIEAADGIIIVTPEYNRSIPGGLNNAIDWASRPYGKNSFARKPVLVSGVSSGKIGTALAQSQLKNVMLYLDANVIGQPELYFGPASELFSPEGELLQESTKELIVKALGVLAARVK